MWADFLRSYLRAAYVFRMVALRHIHDFSMRHLFGIDVLICARGGRSVRLRFCFQEKPARPGLLDFLEVLYHEFIGQIALL